MYFIQSTNGFSTFTHKSPINAIFVMTYVYTLYCDDKEYEKWSRSVEGMNFLSPFVDIRLRQYNGELDKKVSLA